MIISVLVAILTMGTLASMDEAAADWPMFQGSLERSGQYDGSLPDDNSTMWEYQADELLMGTPTVADGVLYYGSLDYHVYAIDAQNGEEIWKTPLDWIIIQAAPAIDIENNQVYVASMSTLYALDLDTGDIVWEFTTRNVLMQSGWVEIGSPVFFGNNVYFGFSAGGLLNKIILQNGKLFLR